MRLIFKRISWDFSFPSETVFLTFDDGPHPDITPWVLDQLKSSGLKATFFCVGENVQRYPEIFQRILKEGHAVGNHSMRHENALKVPSKVYMDSLEEADQYIQSDLFRPPYGKLTPLLIRKIRKKYKIVLWSWMSYDFDLSVSNATILMKADKQIKAGDIIVMHDNPKFAERQKQLLPEFIELLKSKQFNSRVLQ